MSLVFQCEHCGTRLAVDPSLAGRKGRCKVCKARMVIPRAPAPAPAPQPAAAADAAPGSWIDALTSNVALKPLTVEKFPALGAEAARKSRFEDDEDETPGPYALAGPPERAPLFNRVRSPINPVKVTYRHQMDRLWHALRWIGDTAYLWSIPCIMVLLVGIILKSRGLAVLGATGVVSLNLIRLASLLSQMAVVPLRESLVQGISFYIPPLTFYVMYRHWKKLKHAAGRLVEPAVTIVLVVLAFTYVPWLYAGNRALGGLGRLREGAAELTRDVETELHELGSQAESKLRKIESGTPGQSVESAARALEEKTRDAVQTIREPAGTRTPGTPR